ncbi:MAG: C13 family peptidase [Candidatus Thorarchaeota archaeon]|jgi:hypothetical protein
MNKNSVLFVLFLFLAGVLVVPVAAKPGYNPPVISNTQATKSYDGFPATIAFSCEVTWDPNTIQSFVWLYVKQTGESSYTRYTMILHSILGPNWMKFTKTLDVNPWKTVYYYIKAREIIDWDYIAYEDRDPSSGSYSVSALIEDTYSKSSSDKWAVVIQGTRNDGSDAYHAHDNAYTDMKNKIDWFSGEADFPTSHTKFLDAADYSGEGMAYNEVLDALEFPKDNGADSNDFIFVYIVSHGYGNGLRIWGTSSSTGKAMTWETVDGVFDNTDYDRLVIVIESCNSGNSIDDLDDSGRLIVTSDDGSHVSNIVSDGEDSYCPFSDKLIEKISSYAIGRAFYDARDSVYAQWPYQDPHINYNSRAKIRVGC